MQSDEVIWQVIVNQGQCSYKVVTGNETFCRNKYNVTSLCNRSSCPLANSRYATVVEEGGAAFLCMKTVERAHTPATLWHRVRLDKNYSTALKQIDVQLTHWSKFLVHKSKQRLTKISQFLMRTRKLMQRRRPKQRTLPARQLKREAKRESKAQLAAQLEKTIEMELLDRLRSGTYDVLEPQEVKNVTENVRPNMNDLTGEKQRKHLELEYEGVNEVNE
ncbi:uncharacterized protein MICPUCDRAFT_49459 [Micromonas pusilla CCMP1545]|uniref:Protein MAK16 homolog n=1 Tax=Micromonas pusilla (strain CCMP1545) TaxID=564608 RepID=C1ML31_MICPC|nr:uncharacterized protein MICPUCDRAFT_49459 [Micromonas pusilla CCMP1545]EEH59864.1 predicted protein [Micromonas pusilla CCMP1545]|eukprot:XP_003056488.1 predicted protein [Micromonas pusilla CCMP1545]